MASFAGLAQEIIWKGKELQSSTYKVIEGEITIRTPEDTVKASKAIIYDNPKRAILKNNVSLVRAGTLVTCDSATYYAATKQLDIQGNAVINSKEGIIRSQAFRYDMGTKKLASKTFTSGIANGIRFSADQSNIYTASQNIQLIGNAVWENDTIKGLADTVYLNKASNFLKMSKKARIVFKNKPDEIAGQLIEIDLKTSKIQRIKGSRIKRKDLTLKAKHIDQKGDDYFLNQEVWIQSADSNVTTSGEKAVIRKGGMQMTGKTQTRILDREKKEILIYAPKVTSTKDSTIEKYNFFTLTNIRGQFDGFADSLTMTKHDSTQEIVLYRQAHLQNDTMYIQGDTLEIYQDTVCEIIRAKRNALLMMITPPNRVNIVKAANVTITKTATKSVLFSWGSTDSYLWNDEKSNVGLNHTTAETQKATVIDKKISRVKTTKQTSSVFTPIRKVDYGYMSEAALILKETYKGDSTTAGLKPIRNFLERVKR